MAANTAPIYARTPDNQWPSSPILTTANTAKDGTGTVATVFTADATEGSVLQRIVVRPTGTNVASVLRVFLNNGGSNATAGNNVLIDEIGLPATTLIETAAMTGLDKTYNLPMKPGYKINVTLGTTVAAGWAVSAHGGHY